MRGGLAAGAAVPGIVRRRLQAGARAHAGIAAVDRGIEQFGQRRSDRLNFRPDAGWALDFGVLPGFLGVSGFFAIARIWDESGSEKRANAPRGCRPSPCQQMSARSRRFGTGPAPFKRSGRCPLWPARPDDIEMNSAATRAAHGPVLGASPAGDDAQQRKRGIAIRAAGQHRRRLQGLFGIWKRDLASG